MAESATTTPRFAFQQSMIPRPASSSKRMAESPKSVITDIRFVSPGSSSSGSKCQPRGLDRSYSTSDGEYSDPDSLLDSAGNSRELGKIEHSGPLESLPETEEAANASIPAEMPRTLSKNLKRGDGEPACRIPLFPAVNGLESTSDSGRGQHGAIVHSSAALRSDKIYEGSHGDRAAFARENSRPEPTSASERSAIGDQERAPSSEWSRHTTSSESASEHDGKVSFSSSARRYTASESGSTRRRDHGSRPTFSAELSSTGMPLERGEESKRRSVGPGAAANFGYSGSTPLRFFPGCNTHAFSPSPRAQKAVGTYTLTPTSSDVGIRHQHRFLSGPLMGSMIPKPPPSKWDDAEKWIVSPGRKPSPPQSQERSLQSLLTGRRHSIAGGQVIRSHHGVGSPDYTTPPGEKPLSSQFEHAFINAGKVDQPKRSSSQKKRSKALSFSELTRRNDASRKSPALKQDRRSREAKTKVSTPSSTAIETNSVVPHDKSRKLPETPLLTHNGDEERVQAPVNDPESVVKTSSETSKDIQKAKRSRSVSMQEFSTLAANTELVYLPEPVVNRRDMGTQMTPIVTPIETAENSLCTTPGITASPSRHNNTPVGIRAYSLGAVPGAVDSLELQTLYLEKLELRDQVEEGHPDLDRSNIWTTREEEEMESAASLREDPQELERFQLAAKATSWEKAELAKTLVRFKSKEAKIKAWEEHQKALAEAEMKKAEAKVEKILASAKEKMNERLAMATKKAAEMTVAAEAYKTQQSSKIAVRAELMRKAGLLSPSRTNFKCCFRVLRT